MCLSDGIWIPILLTALSLPAAGAEQQKDEGDRQVQAAAPVSSEKTAQVPEEGQASRTTADPRSFSGAEGFNAGTAGRVRSYFSPSFMFSEMSDSNFSVRSGPQRFETINTLIGRFALQRVGKHSQTIADYLGGGLIYNHHSELNTTIHQLGITQSYQGRRWGVLLDDRATYLPESIFGYGGFGWGGALGPHVSGAYGSNLPNLNPVFSLNGGILNGRGSRVSNTVVGQVQYVAGPRSAITLAGSYGLLHFRESGFIDSRNAFFLAGYSRSLTARDYFGVNYGYGLFRYQHSGPSFKTNFLQLNYGHRITGRMAMELGAGPQLNVFSNPLAGSTTPLSWTAYSSLDYRSPRADVALSFSRYTTNGAGVLIGAITDRVQVAWSEELTRNWSGSLSPGYAHSRSLPQTTRSGTQNTFDSAFVGASLSRRLGRYATMFFTYNFQTQRGKFVPCPAANCGTSLRRHLVGFGFDWHPRQIRVD